jgi:hypothetical protein
LYKEMEYARATTEITRLHSLLIYYSQTKECNY